MRIEVKKKPLASHTMWGWLAAVIAILILIWLVAEFGGGGR